jgi:broad specificity phosphatase PhoE
MKTLEVRRHSMRKAGGGSQLSQEGVSYARRIGASIGPFALVAATVVPRTRETALAMGFAVDHELVTLVSDEGVFEEAAASVWWEAPLPFEALAALLDRRGATWRYASSLVAMWRDILTGLPDGAAALVIGHSGELEMALVACFPGAEHAGWGGPFGHCEGVRLSFGGDPERFTAFELLRETQR